MNETTSGFGGPRMLYGMAIRDAIAKGDVNEMRAVLGQAKQLLNKQGDLKAAIDQLEATLKPADDSESIGNAVEGVPDEPRAKPKGITTIISGVLSGTPTPSSGNVGNGLYVVDLQNLQLSAQAKAAIEQAIKKAVADALARLDQSEAASGLSALGGRIMGFKAE